MKQTKEEKRKANDERLQSIGMLCSCGSVLSAVTYTCVRGKHCPFPPAVTT